MAGLKRAVGHLVGVHDVDGEPALDRQAEVVRSNRSGGTWNPGQYGPKVSAETGLRTPPGSLTNSMHLSCAGEGVAAMFRRVAAIFRRLHWKRRHWGVTGAPRRIWWRREVSVSVATMTTLLVCLGLVSLAAVTFADRLVAQGVARDLLGVLQALVIIFLSSLFGGLILRGAFRQWLGEDPDAGALTGIASIYPSREAARQRMLDWVDDPETRTIWLVGISHRDFLLPAGRLRDVWSAIHERLRQESQDSNLGKEKRLHVRVLLLNPESSEGMFRQHIEAASLNIPENRIGLSPDVEAALTELDRTNKQLYPRVSVENTVRTRTARQGHSRRNISRQGSTSTARSRSRSWRKPPCLHLIVHLNRRPAQ